LSQRVPAKSGRFCQPLFSQSPEKSFLILPLKVVLSHFTIGPKGKETKGKEREKRKMKKEKEKEKKKERKRTMNSAFL